LQLTGFIVLAQNMRNFNSFNLSLMNIIKKSLACLAMLAALATVKATPYTVTYFDSNLGTNVTGTADVTLAYFGGGLTAQQLSSTGWFGNLGLALALSDAVGTSLGMGNQWYNLSQGPWFAFGQLGDGQWQSATFTGVSSTTTNTGGPGPYAIGTFVAAPSGGNNVPDGASTLGLLALTASGIAALRRKFTRA
jgi:hypothetical protein